MRARLRQQTAAGAAAITDGVVMRFEHVYEVDPDLMQHFKQQAMPLWDTERIVDSRREHLDWMHNHFADEVLLAGGDRAGSADDARRERRRKEGPRRRRSGMRFSYCMLPDYPLPTRSR